MDQHKKKKRKRSHKSTDGGGNQHQQQLSKVDKQKTHEEKLALSQQLRQLSSQKRLKECIELYKSTTNDELRDAHHGSIVVDCCARCGDVQQAEKIVYDMLSQSSQSKSQQKDNNIIPSYFWQEYKQITYKAVPIQAWTALLKGYVHSGMMDKADSLFTYLCDTHRAILLASNNGSKKRKRETENGVNVRTLNTLLRGCLWTATSPLKDKLVGGVMTASRAWSICKDVNIEFDTSSYEYYISILSQSLQCKAAEDCLQKMRVQFGIERGKLDPTMIESLVVCLVVIARGYVLLGNISDGKRCAREALEYMDTHIFQSSSIGARPSQSSSDTFSAKKQQHQQTTGGKKAWSHTNRDTDGTTGRREESNKLFRSHRLTELRSEASSLVELCTQESDAIESSNVVAKLMMTRLLYFSGGGTTGKDATEATTKTSSVNAEEDIKQWMHSLWHSFGLKEIVSKDGDALQSIFHHNLSPKKKKKKKQKQLPSVLSTELCTSLQTQISGTDSVISRDSGHVDFSQVFTPLNEESNASSKASYQSKKLHVELGSGSGDWACLQAKLNPSDNYVTVELRSDRVAQTFAKCILNQQQTKHAPLTNLCCVGSECGSFLRERVKNGTVQTIFVNHPEPPTQTYNSVIDEEPAHMLNSQTIISATRCLQSNGKGRLIIVTDNLIYARLICQTVVRVLENNNDLVGLQGGEVRDLRRIESFGRSSVHLYEGQPSTSIGHFTPNRFEGGTSYFDRLWRTGAGKHADMRKRFIIALRTSGGESISYGNKDRSSFRSTSGKGKAGSTVEGKKSNKKKSAEKQKRRNERRLAKKQREQKQK